MQERASSGQNVNPQKKRKQDIPEKNYSGLEERTAKVEGILEQMDKRLDRIEAGLVDLKNEVKADVAKIEEKFGKDFARLEENFVKLENKVETKIEALSYDIKSNFKWIIGIMLSTWLTTMAALITAILTIMLKVK